jgi:uncharacterized protein
MINIKIYGKLWGDFYKFPLIIFRYHMGNIVLRLQNISTQFKSLNRITFILILTSALYILAICFNLFFGLIKGKDIILIGFPSKEKNIALLLFSSIILAPIFETILGQSLPYYLLNKIKYLNERSYLILLISALFFGLIHFYSLFYILYGFLLGLVLMYGYMIRIRSDKKTYFLIVICHSLLNLGILMKNLF